MITRAEKRRAAREALWEAGELGWLLHSAQKRIREQYRNARARRFVFNCSRRWGKSWMLLTEAFEQCLKHPGSAVKYAASTGTDAEEILVPLSKDLLSTCPEHMKPAFDSKRLAWTFANGSRIKMAGCDNGRADRLRGTRADLAIVDEAGFVDDLDYVIKNVMMPQLLTTNGRMILASTPAETPGHPFALYCTAAESIGAYAHQTIYDAPHISAEQIEEWCADAGGPESTTWRREYLAQHVTDESRAVIPEWAAHEHVVVEAREWPEYAHLFVAGDQGYYDLSVFAFGYYDFRDACDVIEDELVLSRATSDTIAREVAAKERALWAGQKPSHQPRTRVIDAPIQVIADMNRFHGLSDRDVERGLGGDSSVRLIWSRAKKDDVDASLNDVRIAITPSARHKLRIHPRCTTTIAHMRGAVWNKSRTDYERSPENGHFDGVDAVRYFRRHIDRSANPWPSVTPGVTLDTHHIPAHLREDVRRSKLARAFGRG